MKNYSINKVAACRQRETRLLALLFLGVLTATAVFARYLDQAHRQSTNSVLATYVGEREGHAQNASLGTVFSFGESSARERDEKRPVEGTP